MVAIQLFSAIHLSVEGAWCDILSRVGGKVRQNRWDLSADVPQMVLLVGSLERCFARRACRERDVR